MVINLLLLSTSTLEALQTLLTLTTTTNNKIPLETLLRHESDPLWAYDFKEAPIPFKDSKDTSTAHRMRHLKVPKVKKQKLSCVELSGEVRMTLQGQL